MSFASVSIGRRLQRPRDNATLARTQTKGELRTLVVDSPRPLYPPALLPLPASRTQSRGTSTTARSTPSLTLEASDNGDLDEESRTGSTPPKPTERFDTIMTTPRVIAQLVQRRKTLSIHPSTSNRWYYEESLLPLVARYDGGPRIPAEENYYTDVGGKKISQSRNPEPSWMRAFLLGSESNSTTAQSIHAARVVSVLGGPSKWTSADLQKLCQTIVYRAGDCPRGTVHTFAHFVLSIQQALSGPAAPATGAVRFAQSLGHEVLSLFVYCWGVSDPSW